ncbi:MAG: nitronate monooxygenase [Burkholderiaceae bacterium]|nr:nitronate monooxygenase [Burkholderiaceae bacterium]
MATPSPRLPAHIGQRLRLPLVAAPMLRVSDPALVAACCRAGVIGAFPTVNARSAAELDDWLAAIGSGIGPREAAAPWAPNLIMRSPRLDADLAVLLAHRPEIVITSVGSPAPVVQALHAVGCQVWADVATLAHARKALEAGADGLVLLGAGAGGQTGWLNPLAFVRALRRETQALLVLAGGMADGVALRAACVLGADLGYAGTRFIATQESAAEPAYKAMLVDCGADDVLLTRAFTGLPTSMLRPSIRANGLDPDRLDETLTPDLAGQLFGAGASDGAPRRWRDVWSAGHSVSGVDGVPTVAELVRRLELEYRAAG